MSIELNIFKRYEYTNEDGFEKIKYIGNKSIGLCASTWTDKIYPIMEKARELTGTDIDIPCYDCYDSAYLAKDNQLKLVEPCDMVVALEIVKEYYESLEQTEDIERKLYYINNILLPNARLGFYFVESRE